MEPNEHQQHPLSSYFTSHTAATTNSSAAPSTVSPANGLLSPSNADSAAGAHMVYPHSVGTAAVTTAPVEPARRKRGRPRKYGTPEQALAAKKTAAAASSSASREKREAAAAAAASSSPPSYSGTSKKAQQLLALGNAGQGFTPHIIQVAAGEDITQRIMLFLQQSRRELCVLSASGYISNASLRQPATSGGSITYEGRFEIISMTGSYVRTDIGGRAGGLSVCLLSSTDGQFIGGGVGGPLKAAGPVQVIVGTFMLDKKESGVGMKADASSSKFLPVGGGASVPSINFSSPVEPVRVNNDQQTFGGSPFLMQPRGMHMAPSRPAEWRGGYDLTGRTGQEASQSPENGDYEQLAD